MSTLSLGKVLALLSKKASTEAVAQVSQATTALSNGAGFNLFSGDEVPLLVLMGQSNMDGRGNLADTPSLQGMDFTGKVYIYNKPITRNPSSTATNRVDNGAWEVYAPGKMVVSPQGTAAAAIGPEFALAKWWAEQHYPRTGKALYIVKCAVGGTSIAPVTTGPDSNWSSDTGQLRELAREYVVRPAVRALMLQGKRPKCIGIVWGQGESDATTTATAGSSYATNLASMIAEFRTAYGFTNPRIILMGLSNDMTSTASEWAKVKAAQIAAAAADPGSIKLVRTDGTDGASAVDRYISGVGAGTIHYSTTGVLDLGYRYAQALESSPAPASYTKTWDVEFFGAASRVGEPLNLAAAGLNAINNGVASMQVVDFPTATGRAPAITWVRSGENAARAGFSAVPFPALMLSALDGAVNVEVIWRMIHDGNVDTKPGLGVRADMNSATGDFSARGYLSQVRRGGSQLTFFMRDAGNNWVAQAGSPVSPTQSPATSNPYWYRLVVQGGSWTLFNSADGRAWTQQFTTSGLSNTNGGKVFMTLYNGLMDKPLGNLLAAHCAFDVILAKKL